MVKKLVQLEVKPLMFATRPSDGDAYHHLECKVSVCWFTILVSLVVIGLIKEKTFPDYPIGFPLLGKELS